MTCRTEYLTGRHHHSATIAWLAMVGGAGALVGLNVAGVDGLVTSAVVFALLVVSLGSAAYGRLGERGAVLLTVDDDTVYFGDEDTTLISYPLDSLMKVTVGGPSDATSDMAGGSERHLTVAGQKYLKLTFRRAEPGIGSRPDDSPDTDAGTDFWRVAIVDGDPAVAAVLARLRIQAPEPVVTQKESTQRKSTQRKSTQKESPQKESTQKSAARAGAVAMDATTPDDDHRVDLERPSTPRIADAGSDEAAQRLWEQAARRHDEILSAYGSYELDPEMLLRFPAVTDVTVEQTQTFHLALDDASALRTDRYPRDRARADSYQQAVAALRRAWIACETNGRRAGSSYLQPADQETLDTALKLYNHAAASTAPAEQATYYGRVRDIVTTMTDRGVLHPPDAAVAELRAVTRRALEAGTPRV